MALMPDSLRLTQSQYDELNRIREAARKRHEIARKYAAKLGRHSFPMLPYECSWAYEEKFRKEVQDRDSIQSNV